MFADFLNNRPHKYHHYLLAGVGRQAFDSWLKLLTVVDMGTQKALVLRYWPRESCRPSSAHHSGQLAHLPGWRRQRFLLHPPHQRCWSPGLWSPCAATPFLAPCQKEPQRQVEGQDRELGSGGQRYDQNWKRRCISRGAHRGCYNQHLLIDIVYDPNIMSTLSFDRWNYFIGSL